MMLYLLSRVLIGERNGNQTSYIRIHQVRNVTITTFDTYFTVQQVFTKYFIYILCV